MQYDTHLGTTPNLWKVKDVANYLKLSEKAVYRLVSTGNFPHIRLGRRLRFSKQDIDRFLSTNRAGDPALLQA